jgi:cation diffusion facilitator family transporter
MQNRYTQIKNATFFDIVKNLFLGFIKIILGYFGKSHALIADGIHSFADLLTDLMVLLGAKYGSQKADADHPYGHARFETIASLGLAVVLVLTGIGIIFNAAENLSSPANFEKPHFFVLLVALFSILLNERIYRYTLSVAKKINSDLLHANALHNRSDVLSSLIVLIGVAASLLGFPAMDAIAAVILGFFVIKMGIDIGWKNISELVDTGLGSEMIEQIHHAIFSVHGVKSIHELRSRRMANRALLEVHIIVDPLLSVSEGHHIGEKVTQALQEKIDLLDNIIVHIDSENDEDYSSTKTLPLRHTILLELEKAWANLPGFFKHGRITLHYLLGKISVELELPHEVLEQGNSVKALNEKYNQAIRNINYIEDVKLLFF